MWLPRRYAQRNFFEREYWERVSYWRDIEPEFAPHRTGPTLSRRFIPSSTQSTVTSR